MPIQINELIIRAVINNSEGDEKGKTGKSTTDKESIIAECVEQVLELLKEKKER